MKANHHRDVTLRTQTQRKPWELSSSSEEDSEEEGEASSSQTNAPSGASSYFPRWQKPEGDPETWRRTDRASKTQNTGLATVNETCLTEADLPQRQGRNDGPGPHEYPFPSNSQPCTATGTRKLKCGKHGRTPGIYLFTFPNNKKYAGQTVWPVSRWNRYKNDKYNKCRALRSAIKKYGWDSIKKEWLHGGPGNSPVAEEDLDQLEIDAIAEHNTLAPNGYNIQPGGKVACRGVERLSRKGPRGPRTQDTVAKIKSTWNQKREERFSEIDPEMARRARNHAAVQSASRKAKRDGTFVNKRFKPSEARKLTWKLKREAKLALLPPGERDAERKRLERNAEKSMKAYYSKARTPGNLRANS
jgi:group I intron endonuclease